MTNPLTAEQIAGIKACPFCGQPGRLQENGLVQNRYHEVVCDQCDFCGPAHTTAEEAFVAWNRRASAPLPEGYALVPIEPTEAMVRAGREAILEYPDEEMMGMGVVDMRAKVAYRAMIAASPAIPTARDGGDEAVAWMGYWPGAGTIAPNVTRTTHSKSIADGWVRDGAEITPLYARAALSNGAQP